MHVSYEIHFCQHSNSSKQWMGQIGCLWPYKKSAAAIQIHYVYTNDFLIAHYWAVTTFFERILWCRTHDIITHSWFETALNYKPRILDPKIEKFPCLVHKMSKTKQQWKLGLKTYKPRLVMARVWYMVKKQTNQIQKCFNNETLFWESANSNLVCTLYECSMEGN